MEKLYDKIYEAVKTQHKYCHLVVDKECGIRWEPNKLDYNLYQRALDEERQLVKTLIWHQKQDKDFQRMERMDKKEEERNKRLGPVLNPKIYYF